MDNTDGGHRSDMRVPRGLWRDSRMGVEQDEEGASEVCREERAMSKLGKKKSNKEGKTKQLQQQLQALSRKNAAKGKK